MIPILPIRPEPHSSAAAAIAEVLETTEIRRKIQLATGHSLTALEQLKGDPVLAE